MDDIESAANPRWDDDMRHKYANHLDQFVKIDDPEADPGTVETAPAGDADYRDHNKWGTITNRYTRHSMSGVRGGGEYVRLGHEFKCGFLQSNYYLPVRYAPLEIEVTVVSDATEPVIKPVTTDVSDANGKDRAGYFYRRQHFYKMAIK